MDIFTVDAATRVIQRITENQGANSHQAGTDRTSAGLQIEPRRCVCNDR